MYNKQYNERRETNEMNLSATLALDMETFYRLWCRLWKSKEHSGLTELRTKEPKSRKVDAAQIFRAEYQRGENMEINLHRDPLEPLAEY